jgi:hypothetical protein
VEQPAPFHVSIHAKQDDGLSKEASGRKKVVLKIGIPQKVLHH